MAEEPKRMGQLGEYTGLQDKDGKFLRIGHVIRMEGCGDDDDPYVAFGRVWFMPPQLMARRVEEIGGELMEGSYELADWGAGQRVAEFTLMEGHPGATWPKRQHKIVVGGPNYSHLGMAGAYSTHKVWWDSVMIGHLHSFHVGAVQNPDRIYLRFTNLRDEVDGPEFASKDVFKDWLREEYP